MARLRPKQSSPSRKNKAKKDTATMYSSNNKDEVPQAYGLRQIYHQLLLQQQQQPQRSPYRVLGIAMVVDQKGKGARMVFRYPAEYIRKNDGGGRESSTANDSTGAGSDTVGGSGNGNSRSRRSEQLFFTLPARQMAKLFRPKHSLCGQPMTLTVGETVFCCRAVLMEENDDNNNNTLNASTSTVNMPSSGAAASGTAATTATINTNNTTNAANTNTSAGINAASGNLVLFSVIVALAPREDTYNTIDSIPINYGGVESSVSANTPTYLEGQKELRRQSSFSTGDSLNSTTNNANNANTNGKSNQMSSSVMSIRRVHISLGRLCRVLQREERRCRYVSLQSKYMLQIRSEFRKKFKKRWEEQKAAGTIPGITKSASAASNTVSAATSPTSVVSGKAAQSSTVTAGGGGGRGHRRNNSYSPGLMAGNTNTGEVASKELNRSQINEPTKHDVHQEHEILELMLAAPPPSQPEANATGPGGNGNGPGSNVGAGIIGATYIGIEHHGNLAGELVQVFNALSRNDDQDFPPAPTVLLSGRDSGVVYLNRHIALAIESVSEEKPSLPSFGGVGIQGGRGGGIGTSLTIRPYQTLLFPNASPLQLVKALQSSGFTAPQPLQQFLLMVNPQKSLFDIAIDANLTLGTTMEIANYLVSHGVCVTSPVLSRSSRLAYRKKSNNSNDYNYISADNSNGDDFKRKGNSRNKYCMNKTQELAMDFSQTFGLSINIFLVISFLTHEGRTLGESIAALTNGEDKLDSSLRAKLLSTLFDVKEKQDDENGEDSIDREEVTNRNQTLPPDNNNNNNNSPTHLASAGKATGAGMPVKTSESGDGDIGADGGGGDGTGDGDGDATPNGGAATHQHAEELEEILYTMAIWLLSHQVLSHVHEYVVAIDVGGSAATGRVTEPDLWKEESALNTGHPSSFVTTAMGNSSSANHDTNNTTTTGSVVPPVETSEDEAFFKELMDLDYLTGNISIVALCWRLGLDKSKIRSWCFRLQDKVRIISRMSIPEDDWGAV